MRQFFFHFPGVKRVKGGGWLIYQMPGKITSRVVCVGGLRQALPHPVQPGLGMEFEGYAGAPSGSISGHIHDTARPCHSASAMAPVAALKNP